MNTARPSQNILPGRYICSSICSAHIDRFALSPKGQQKTENGVGSMHCRYQLTYFGFSSVQMKYATPRSSGPGTACQTKAHLSTQGQLDLDEN